MPSERDSPSAGWRSVYAEMGATTAAEERHADRRPCRECGRPSVPHADGPYCRRHRDGGTTDVERPADGDEREAEAD